MLTELPRDVIGGRRRRRMMLHGSIWIAAVSVVTMMMMFRLTIIVDRERLFMATSAGKTGERGERGGKFLLLHFLALWMM